MKRRYILVMAVVLLVVLAWTGGWLFVAGEIRKGVGTLADADGVETPRIMCGNTNVGGFPFRFDLTCGDATIVSADLSARLAELRASVLVYQPTHLLVFALGPVDIADAMNGSKSRIDWTNLEASVRLTDWRIARASLVIENPAWTDTLVTEAPIATAAQFEFHLLDIPEQHDPVARTAALAAYSTLTDVVAAGFDIEDGASTIEAEVTGLPDDVREFVDPDILRRWQQSAGRLKLVGIKGGDADQSLEAIGDLGLDDAGRLDGQLNITSHGLVERFGILVPPEFHGLILGNPAADGSYTQNVSLRSGIVFSGLLPAGAIPPLW